MAHVIETFEDLKALEGQEIGVSGWKDVTQDQINQFAESTNDHQWIHVDIERAKNEMPNGKTIAHGYLTLAMIPAMTAEFIEFKSLKNAINYGVNKVRFTNMVQVESKIRARATIKTTRQRAGAIQVIGDTTVEIQGQDKPACIAETVSFYYLES
ncbi:MAG: MaoC family dehydratase [Gammaproteobacteria bacterium]|jgi:acyl dehydratase|nr:MaoC family dehydratase [Gammaproteobacteria bacterium]MBT5216122.1 MaoC family dehydratase [Gammaproteobacteria bacterium]MBT5542738.1 MaoC family dehydratase [Gammaproteobacteria bacterium]MBT6073659.1 MaoC family dehydratase [Gammaproteobacteria bacterium]MBT7753681.1 MaoC family dehydratase [Gammaproteobacteria bacterium]